MMKPISISLSPNTEADDVRLAFGLLFRPWKWKKASSIENQEFSSSQGLGGSEELEHRFQQRFQTKHAYAFNSGRSSFFAILKSLHVEKGDEVFLQAFTCNAVPNPVLWAGLEPVYVDCNEDDFNISVEDLEKKITLRQAQGKHPKVVVVQHTFGLPADMDKILEICKKHNLVLIEDCAHALGAKYKGREVGTFGTAAFFSFSRDKIISSVYGGMAITNNETVGKKIQLFQEEVGYPSIFWVFQQLLHPVVLNWKILPTYKIFGKYVLVISQHMHILSKAVHWKEKRGIRPEYFPKRIPNALAILAIHQLEKLERFNAYRKELADKYDEELSNTSFGLPKRFENREHVFLRYAIKSEHAYKIIQKAWAKNLLLGDWYTNVLAPNDTQLEKLHYIKGSCPAAEKLAQQTLNLPTHINIKEKEFRIIVEFIKHAH